MSAQNNGRVEGFDLLEALQRELGMTIVAGPSNSRRDISGKAKKVKLMVALKEKSGDPQSR